MSLRPFPLLIFAAGVLFAAAAQAACPNQNASGGESPEGAVDYNADHKTMQFCDGTTWWAMKNGGGLPSCAEGDTIVMTSSGWGCSEGGSCDSYSGSVDAFTFSDTESYANTGTDSGEVTITGLNEDVVYACVSDDGNPSIIVGGVDRGAGPVPLVEGAKIQLRGTAASTDGTIRTVTLPSAPPLAGLGI